MVQDKKTPLIPKDKWLLSPSLCFLNHGSFGACPIEILNVQRNFQDRLERSPVAFFIREANDLLHQSRAWLAQFLNCDTEGLVFIRNASEGVSTALRSLDLSYEDEVLCLDHIYPACRHMLSAIRQKTGVGIREIPTDEYVRSPVECINQMLQTTTRQVQAVIIDHITSASAFSLDHQLSFVISNLREQGIKTIIDGAHAPGQLMLNINELAPDYYIGNLHKWLFAPKGTAFLWINTDIRRQVKPQTISHGFLNRTNQLHALFDWVGTQDMSAWFTLPMIGHWLNQNGGIQSINQYNQNLCTQAYSLIAQALNELSSDHAALPLIPPVWSAPNMVAIPLSSTLLNKLNTIIVPKGQKAPSLSKDIHPLQNALFDRNIEVPITEVHGTKYLRISAQAYNHIGEYAQLADELQELFS